MQRILLFDDREIRVLNTPAEHGVFKFTDVSSHEQAVRLLTPFVHTPHGLHQLRMVLAEEGTGLDPFRLTDDKVIDEMAVRLVDRRVRLAKDVRSDELWFVPQEGPEPGQPPPAGPAAKPKEKKLTWIELQFFDEKTAKPVNNLRIILKTTDGNENYRTTNADGVIRVDDIEPGSCDARCEAKGSTVDDTLAFVAPGDPPAPDPKARPLVGSTVWRVLDVDLKKLKPDGRGELGEAGKDWSKPGLGTAQRHKFRVKPLPKYVWIVELEHVHFNHDSATLLADHDIETDPKKPRPTHVTALDVIAETLREADRSPHRRLLIAGHTDTSGSAQYNLPLSSLRAESALACLTGDRARWVEISHSKHKVECYQVILKWVARDQNFNCDPGPVTNTNNEQTKAAVLEFQKQYNQSGIGATIGEDGIVGRETWGAFFDFYQLELKQVLKVDDAGLSALRGKLQFVDGGKKFVGCGEHFPKAARGVDGFRSQENRRVELLFFNENKLPKLDCHPGGGTCNHGVCEVNDPAIFIPAIIPVNPLAPPKKPTVKFVKIMTSDPVAPPAAPVFKEDDDFSPRLNEQIRFHVSIEDLPPGFTGKVRVDAGRLTNAPVGANPDANGAFALCGRVELDIAAGANPLPVEVVWDGKATVAVPLQLSNRTTPNNNGGAAFNIPLHDIPSGDVLTHGLYHVDQVSVLDTAGKIVAKDRPADIDFSVPAICNLHFNGDWVTDLAAFGLSPFQAQLEEAIRRFGTRDYQHRAAANTDKINVRFVVASPVTNAQSIKIVVGGARASGLFGSTPLGAARLNNLFSIDEGAPGDLEVFPGTFMLFNQAANQIGPTDQADFRATFRPLGVGAAANAGAIGVASARAVAADGSVTGAADATDVAGAGITFDDDGMATVTSTDPATVPAARAADLQRALRRFVFLVGNTTNHEAAHGFGVVSIVQANNKITVGGTTVTSPLDGDPGVHNKVTANTNIVDAGATRSFTRRTEMTGVVQQFNAANMRYLRDCIPFDRKDN